MKTSFSIKYFFLLLIMQHCFFLGAQDHHAIDSLQNIIKSTQNDTIKVSALIMLSRHHQNSDVAKSFDYGLQAHTLSVKLKYPAIIGRTHNNLGHVYWYNSNYSSASTHYFKALKIYEGLNDKAAIAECYRNIGWIYQGQKNYNLTLDYYLKSLKINQGLDLKFKIQANYADLSGLYKKIKKFPEAIEYCLKTKQIAEQNNNTYGIAACSHNMGEIYFEMGKYDLAAETFKRAVNLYKKENSFYNNVGCHIGLANSYLKLNYPDKVIEYAEESLKLAKKFNYKAEISSSYQLLALAYSLRKEYATANNYSKLYTIFQDSIYNENNSRQINEMTAKYESEKKIMMINSLEKDKTLSKEKLESEKNFKIYLLIFSVLIMAFAAVLFKGNLQKRKANAALSFAYQEIEIKRKDISDSINYSKRIQDASLSPKELKYKLFPDAFVLFKPKDIVSGDFYWYTEKNGKKLIAACDCTGHGVPGALMSMIGNNFLNQIVNEKGITSPDEVLNHLHIEVRNALKQEEQKTSQDGMDIAIITFNSETEIEYAGAQRPLWIIKKIENEEPLIDNDTNQKLIIDNRELVEIKPEKFSIGGYQSESERKFIKHKISLSKEDCLYIFSDGFADQFGGPEKKRFMSKRFKKLLLDNYTKPMMEQEHILLATIDAWKEDQEQVDDILVIGMRV